MTKFALMATGTALAGALCGCQTLQPALTPDTSKLQSCGADKVQNYIGRPADPATRSEVEQKSKAGRTRWITPDMMVTMDYRDDRLNAHLGTDGRIGSFSCG